MKNEQQIEAYKKMAKEAASVGMETRIKANLEKTCDKFKGHEDKLPGCIAYLTSVAKEILGGKNGDESQRDVKLMKPGAKVHEALNSWLDKYKADVTKALKGAA